MPASYANIGMMKPFAVIGLCVVLAAGCSGASTPAPADTATAKPAAPALIEIPSTPGRPAAGGGDMRTLEPHVSDLDGMIERGVIRVLVAPGRTHFETVNGVQQGRTVDAAAAFEQFVNERIAPRSVSVIITPSTEASAIGDLLAGQGDIAANVAQTFERDENAAFATPMRSGIRELVVTNAKDAPLVSLEDVGGRTIHVQRDSDHHASLVRLNGQLKSINRLPAKIVTGDSTAEDLLGLVNAGKIPATVAHDYVFDHWRKSMPALTANLDVAVSQDIVLSWVTRKDAPKLLALVNEFFSKYRLTF